MKLLEVSDMRNSGEKFRTRLNKNSIKLSPQHSKYCRIKIKKNECEQATNRQNGKYSLITCTMEICVRVQMRMWKIRVKHEETKTKG